MSDPYVDVMVAFGSLPQPLTSAVALKAAKGVLPPDKAFQFEQWWTTNGDTFLKAYNARTALSA